MAADPDCDEQQILGRGVTPMISIVMSVFNDDEHIDLTVQSILQQSFRNFELIIIDDGSTDGTGESIERLSTIDPRILAVHQDHAGLTAALILGCSRARGEYIARHDVGDISEPQRLEQQLKIFAENPAAALVAGGASFSLSSGEVLYRVTMPGMRLDRALRSNLPHELRGPPHHGGTMFRRDDYGAVGGYRKEFLVAQDIDLWLRLSKRGVCLGTEQVLYRALIQPNAISINRHSEQLYFRNKAVESAKMRERGEDDSALLQNMIPVPKKQVRKRTRSQIAAYNYFVASCLQQESPEKAIAYLDEALKANPFHLKALIRRLACTFR